MGNIESGRHTNSNRMKLLLLLTLLLCGCTKDYTVFYCPEKKVYKNMSVADSLYLQDKSGCKMEIIRNGRVFYSRKSEVSR